MVGLHISISDPSRRVGVIVAVVAMLALAPLGASARSGEALLTVSAEATGAIVVSLVPPEASSPGVVLAGSPGMTPACRVIEGAVIVRSNQDYVVTISPARDHPGVRFFAARPSIVEDCLGGEEVRPGMLIERDGAWTSAQPPTAGRMHRYWLGVELDPPDPALEDDLLFGAVPVS